MTGPARTALRHHYLASVRAASHDPGSDFRLP